MNINATLIGQTIAFIVFVWFCMKFVWPPIMKAIEERQKKIADGLAAGERAEKDLEQAQQAISEQLAEAKAEAARLIDQAKKRGSKIVEEETQKGNAEREKIIASGYAEVESERNRIREELRKQLAVLAISGAEKIIEREIDKQAHNDIIEKLAAEL
ncbi:F0F1 ATP synthase subunit B [Idiomarina tyrosinivorans]|uniref:ATP synthase subunit b n=1 Tax=Idiomarina tyrosinivorans TaxID=1445662 RepID=A0A432ZSW6_9GAMM|nr:F0F1 ATP synthase subunit B [Idiomarina tyrosinivorans]RUO80973.1 F0F1 ATP synthase subunit B [Idiomarina tyrosinivorans]